MKIGVQYIYSCVCESCDFKSLQFPVFPQEHFVTEKKEKPVSMNAFELISRSQGFSLENLFGKQTVC